MTTKTIFIRAVNGAYLIDGSLLSEDEPEMFVTAASSAAKAKRIARRMAEAVGGRAARSFEPLNSSGWALDVTLPEVVCPCDIDLNDYEESAFFSDCPIHGWEDR